jgi:putative glutamine amidotransferase
VALPVIGITIDQHDQPGRYESPVDYAKSVELAGGLPVLLPYQSDLSLIPQYVDLLDGILFSGGDDLDPSVFGQTRHAKAVPIDPLRQKFEMALLAEVERRRMPALGICLGSQLMNVYRGEVCINFCRTCSGRGCWSTGNWGRIYCGIA